MNREDLYYSHEYNEHVRLIADSTTEYVVVQKTGGGDVVPTTRDKLTYIETGYEPGDIVVISEDVAAFHGIEANIVEILEAIDSDFDYWVDHNATGARFFVAARDIEKRYTSPYTIDIDQIGVYEAVEHPEHYNNHPSGVECIDIIRNLNTDLGNVVKYVWRAGLKPGADNSEDLAKAAFYMEDFKRHGEFIGSIELQDYLRVVATDPTGLISTVLSHILLIDEAMASQNHILRADSQEKILEILSENR